MEGIKRDPFAQFQMQTYPKNYNPQPINPQNQDEPKKMSGKTKAVITLATVSAALALTYFAGKKHLLGDGVYNFLNRVQNSVSGTDRAVANFAPDRIEYDIMPPIYDRTIVPNRANGESGFAIYNDIVENMKRDANTSRRLNEVCDSIGEDLGKIREKIGEVCNPDDIYIPNSKHRETFQFDIAKKRFYSIPENSQEGYSCLDPLMYQKPREEIVDMYVGYSLLQEANEGSECKVLNDLRQTYLSSISSEDSAFLDDCVQRVLPEGAKCHGAESVVHTSELSRIGRIFREAMGIEVH